MIIGVDFDAVLADKHRQPIEGAKRSLEFLVDQGHKPYIFTARPKSEHKYVRDWLKHHKFPKLVVSNIKKEHVRVIIDDRAIRFTNWNDIVRYFG